MAENGFAVLVAGDHFATHLPLVFKDDGSQGALYGHVSRANPVCAALDGGEAMAVFSGPHGYVSASLYDNPTTNVPTWNYASVQVRGRLSLLPDADVVPHLKDIARIYEGEGGWTVGDAPDYVARLVGGISAFRLEIESLTAFRKMSGNKSDAIRKRIIDAVRAGGEQAFANEMERAPKGPSA